MKKIFLFLFVFLFLATADYVSAHAPRLIYQNQANVKISEPEKSQAFYDELKGKPRYYFLNSASEFDFYINLLVPETANYNGRYSANVFFVDSVSEKLVVFIDGSSVEWKEFYEPFGRDYYLKGPEFEKKLPAGNYKIEVFSNSPADENIGKYVLAVGKNEIFTLPEIINAYWQLPLLKIEFFKTSVAQFFFTPFFITFLIALVVLVLIIWLLAYLIGLTNIRITGGLVKTIILTSSGMQGSGREILKILAKPADKITVAHITTASKAESDISYMERDRELMKKAGFNVEDIDIEGKNRNQLMKLLESKDIIYVQGGNTFYLMKHIRLSGFDKVVRKLVKRGVMYVGVSAGSIVAGKTIETAGWKNADRNTVNLKNLNGMNLVNFNVFVHYRPEWAEIIKQKIPNPKNRKNLKILTDSQALIVQGKNILLVGEEYV